MGGGDGSESKAYSTLGLLNTSNLAMSSGLTLNSNVLLFWYAFSVTNLSHQNEGLLRQAYQMLCRKTLLALNWALSSEIASKPLTNERFGAATKTIGP